MIIEIANRSQAVVRAEHGPMERNLSLAQRSGLANVGCPGFQMPRDLVLWKLWWISITCCGFFSCRVMVWGYFQGFRSAGCLQMRPTVVIAMLFTSGWYDRFKVPPLHLSICLWPQSPCSSAMLMAKCAKRSGWEMPVAPISGMSSGVHTICWPGHGTSQTSGYQRMNGTTLQIHASPDPIASQSSSSDKLPNIQMFEASWWIQMWFWLLFGTVPQFDFSVGLNLPTKIFFIMLISSLDVHLHPS